MDAGSSQQPAGSSTLKQLCPEDKEKVAKLLRQVVQLGQENAALRTKAEKADKDDKEGKDKINQWQDCNKQVILNNIRLKGKLSQLVTLLRMYHHKVQVLDAALRATQNQQGSPGSAAAAAAAAEAALQACLSDGQEQPGGQQQQLPSLDGGMAAGTGSSLPHNSTGSTGRGAAPDTGAGTASSSSSLSALALCSPAAAAGGPLSSAPSDRQAAGVVLLAPPRSQQPSPAMVCAPGQLLQFDPSVGPHGAFVLLDAVDLLSEEDQKAAQLQQPTALGSQQHGPPLALPSSAESPQPPNLDVLEQVEAWSPPRRGHHPAAAAAATAAASGAAAASSMGHSSGAGLLGPGHSAWSFTAASEAMNGGAGDSFMPNATWPSSRQQAPYSMNGVTGTAAGAGVAAGAAATIPTAWRQGPASAAADGVDASSPTRGKLLNLARAFDSLAGRQAPNQGADPVQQQEQQAASAGAGGGAWSLPTGMAAAARGLLASRSAASTAGAAVEPRVLYSSRSPGDSHHQQQQRHVPVLPPDQPLGFGLPWPTAASAPGHVEEVAVEADSSVPVAITKEPSWWHRGQAAAAAAASYAPEPAYSSSSNAGAAWGQTGPMQDWQAQQQSVLRGAADASTSSSRRHTAAPQCPPAAAAAIDGPYPPYWQQQQQQHMDDMLPWQQQYYHSQQPPDAGDLGWGVPQEAPGGAAPMYSPTSSPEAARPSWEQPGWGVSSRSLSAAGAGAVPFAERTVLGSFQRQGPSTGGQLAQQQQPQAPSRQQQVYSSASSSVRGRHTLPSGRNHAGGVPPHVGVAQLRGGTAGGSGSGGTSYWSPPGSKWPVQSLPPPAPAAAASAGAGVSRRSRAASAAGGARSSSKGQALRPMRDAASTQQHSRAPLREMQQQQQQQQQQGGAPAQQQGEVQDWEVEPEVLEVCRSLSRSSMVSTRSQPSQQQPPQQSPQQQQQMVRGYLRTPRTSTVAGMPLYGSGRAPSLAAAAAAAAQGQRGHHRMSVASSCWDEEAVSVGLQQAGPAAEMGVAAGQQLLEAAAADADSSSVLARYDESLMEVLLQVERLEQQHGRYQQELQHVQPAHLMHG